MLEREELVKLNNYMLGLGMPDRRDDIGYNRPDYAVMSHLAYIPADKLTEAQIGVLANTLRHYTNTQLEDRKDEISETVDFYDRKLTTERDRNYLLYVQTGDRGFIRGANAEYLPSHLRGNYNLISLVQANEKGLLLDFKDTNIAHSFKNQNEGVYYTQKNGKWQLFVPYEKMEDFVRIMTEPRKSGAEPYVLDENLKKVMENLDGFRAYVIGKLKAEKEEPAVEISVVKDRSEKMELMVYYDGFRRDLNDFRNSHSDSVKLYKDKDGRWVTGLKYGIVDEWKKKAKEYGYVLTEELERFSGAEALKKIEEEKAEEDAKRIARHKGDFELVDVEKLPLPFVPYDFQLEDARRALMRDKMLLGHDMGCGKTFISGLVGSSIPKPKLVICPETLRRNWKKEMEYLGCEANILYSKDKFSVSGNPNSFTIVGYQTAGKFVNELLAEDFEVVFVDEVHNCKAVDNGGNPSSKRAESVIEIVQNAKYAYLLSGTPIPTRNKDLFNILKMLDVDEIDFNEKWAFFKYGQKYCDGFNNGYGWDFTGNSQSEELHELLAPYMIRRMKKDVLPNLTKQRMFIPLEVTDKEYRQLEKRLFDMEEEDTYMGLAMTGRRVLSKSKVKSAIEFADGLLNEDKSVVIVSNFNETLDTLKAKYGDDCCVIRGGMSDSQKQQAIDDFQSGKKKVCALNIIAGGVGVTLTKAHDMIICDYDWTPANMIQVEDRICRAGQTECCNIHYLYGEDCVLDEIFVEMITGKNANIDRVVDNTDNSLDLVQGVSENSNSYLNLLQERIEGEKLKKFEEKNLIAKAPETVGEYQVRIEKSEDYLDRKKGYPVYEVTFSNADGEVQGNMTLKRADVSGFVTKRDYATVNRLTKALEAGAEEIRKEGGKEPPAEESLTK